MSRHTHHHHSGGYISGWGVLIAAAVIVAYGKWIMFAILIGVGIFVTAWGIDRLQRNYKIQKARVEADLAMIRNRAEYENWLAYQGDPLGTYGQYSPPTMPLGGPPTNETNPYLFGGYHG